ncbi:uncharacterized protein LOC128883413 isoform X2 [Hylaeus volcanicus]|uniref:uncharacterized protein LOC128883413 isoform X2 n=1 Tax=Hylaeus volcanicus TaxID=313075 RepID=UPI0023B82F2E|nr:uncharacterized protein LOC128883413 isoform X2 [Hylaeus volcanicus]
MKIKNEKFNLNIYFVYSIHLVSVAYILLLFVISTQDIHHVRKKLQSWNIRLKDYSEISYALDCNIFTPGHPKSLFFNVQEKIDIFVLAHFFGWFIKALIIRDTALLWTLSIFFELMEITFRHILPNFHECWWDHIVLDVLGCNCLGIVLGIMLVDYLNLKRRTWYWNNITSSTDSLATTNATVGSLNKSSRDTCPKSVHNQLVSLLKNINSWKIKHFHSGLSSFWTYCTMLVFVFVATFADVNVFFLKSQMQIVTSHWIVFLRTVFITLAAILGTDDIQHFVTNFRMKRFGLQGILNIFILLTELWTISRYWKIYDSHPPLPYQIQILLLTLVLLVFSLPLVIFLVPSMLCGFTWNGKKKQ